ncbi:hypothetical protein BJ122_11835 [Rhodopseudomonas faecalis]|uniref:Uncharacterized protein n=1 Tax=Rhodopseudomonas faecalis TaxID=99655 RepID=A0A318TIR3_9BRAD|nr:DUF6496 domain-containing protein [Rhodopseudomonas faecalis]PYF01725.1 hypothetical protein BJ122_11835 [Rhodopseudomonas faecalis]TAH66968.1 MAG: hypothetical protein EWM45_09450 [Rhodopseudomonas palustris]
MARNYSKAASSKVERAMKKRKAGTLKSGRSGKTVTSRKQAIAIGLSEARSAGNKVPKEKSSKRASKTAKTTKAAASRRSSKKSVKRSAISKAASKRKGAKK